MVQENLREPMKAISKLLFEKPAGNEMQEAVERSRKALQRMIDVAAERVQLWSLMLGGSRSTRMC